MVLFFGKNVLAYQLVYAGDYEVGNQVVDGMIGLEGAGNEQLHGYEYHCPQGGKYQEVVYGFGEWFEVLEAPVTTKEYDYAIDVATVVGEDFVERHGE